MERLWLERMRGLVTSWDGVLVKSVVAWGECEDEPLIYPNQGRQKEEVRPRPKARYKLGSPGKGRYMQSKGDGT
ncbi:hypothetical protein FOYG_04483 [Fusarium oxysporum NRRL 32931]|uniref:Uncharacterized protein n=1 Tax=Fusarium oxysporum NRRL 32931 TaxID=660029 RepID=W9IKI5_FUSOX|nr:hypothetical protein FOYG_04483 [Fusarium oxysporum NRRL 32931]KAJ0140255.1 Glycerophosphodiester phosphodiesterase 1 [Fusarium oxysporum f. sp. albedinis]